MRTAAMLSGLVVFFGLITPTVLAQPTPELQTIGSQDNYETIHNLGPAHDLSLGQGAKVGILGHSFLMDVHPEIYAGGENFQGAEWEEGVDKLSRQGYWMALALREIAPKAQIYALNTYASREADQVKAMVRAIDWAIENGLDALTYCGEAFSPEARMILDPAVERAVEAGVAVVFVNYPHPLNLFPGGMPAEAEDKVSRAPDLNIYSYDCAVLLAGDKIAFMSGDDDGLEKNLPVLNPTSPAPIAAGFVALMKSVDPELSPAKIKSILIDTSRPMSFDGRLAAHVPDAFQALLRVSARPAQQ